MFRPTRFLSVIRRLHQTSSQRAQVKHFSSEKPMEGLFQCPANYVPLSPISFLQRAGIVYRDRVSVIYGSVNYTWKETLERCLRLASALTQLGISRGDVVATLAPNVPAMYELHFGVPMAGAVLCTLNIRCDSEMVSRLLRHSEAKIIFVDYQLLDIAHGAFKLLSMKKTKPPKLVLITESDNPIHDSTFTSTTLEYESLLKTGNPDFEIGQPKDELDPISLNYTSGSTSSPKGVVYKLQPQRCIYQFPFYRSSSWDGRNACLPVDRSYVPLQRLVPHLCVYLWTVPQGGTNVCLRKVTLKNIYENIMLHKVNHLGGAPTVLNMIVNATPGDRKTLPWKVEIMTGGAPPPPQILFKMEELGFNVSHQYGLTETYGPGTICMWKPEWEFLPPDKRAKLKSRQGLQLLGVEVDIKNPITLKSVPPDGKTMGEVMFRGNTVMSGYLKDLKATQEAFGWWLVSKWGSSCEGS